MTTPFSNQILRSLYERHNGLSPVITPSLWLGLSQAERLCLSVARLSTYVQAQMLPAWNTHPPDTRRAMIESIRMIGSSGSQIASLLDEAAALSFPNSEDTPVFTPDMIAAFTDRISNEIAPLIPILWECLEPLVVQDDLDTNQTVTAPERSLS